MFKYEQLPTFLYVQNGNISYIRQFGSSLSRLNSNMSKSRLPKVEESDSAENILYEEALDNEDGVSKCNQLFYLGKKRSWTADEDTYLMKLVQKYGAQKWTSIA